MAKKNFPQKTNQQIYDIYILQSKNVRKLLQVKKNLIKDINQCLKKSKTFEVETKTKILALLYSAWSEAQFIQILHTPSGFSPIEIEAIEMKRGIIPKWKHMIQTAFSKVGDILTDPDLKIKYDEIIQIIDKYIKKQSSLRNKIAHGQWVHALDENIQKEEVGFTIDLQNLDYVEFENLFEIHKYLGSIVRHLVQSPQKAFKNEWVKNFKNLNDYIQKTTGRTQATKLNLLAKRDYRPKQPVRNQLLQEIELIPESELAELYNFIHYFRLGLEKAQTNNQESILKFARCWQEMSEEEFTEFTDELTERRRQAFSQRRKE